MKVKSIVPFAPILMAALMYSNSALSQNPDIVSSNYVYSISLTKERVVYLFGSTHISFSKAPIRLGQCVKNLLAKSKSVRLEADHVQVKQLEAQEPKTVKMDLVLKHLDTNTQNDILKVLNIPQDTKLLADADALSVLNLLNSIIPHPQEILGVSDFGLDAEVFLSSRFLNIDIAYIEPPEEQYQFFRRTPANVYADAIRHSLSAINNQSKAKSYWSDLLQSTTAAAKGDENALLRILNQAGMASYYQHTLLDRNEQQAKKVAAILQSSPVSPTFIALGAAHLAGADGVVERLKRQGFAVQRVCQ